MLCAKFQNDGVIEKQVMSQNGFTRCELGIGSSGISYISMFSLLLSCREEETLHTRHSIVLRILLIGPIGTNFSEILIKVLTFSFKKMHLKVSSANWLTFCFILNVLTIGSGEISHDISLSISMTSNQWKFIRNNWMIKNNIWLLWSVITPLMICYF